MKLKYKLVNKQGKIISRHFTKKQAQIAQLKSNNPYVYVKKL